MSASPQPPKERAWPIFIISLLVITMIMSMSVLYIANMDGGAKVIPDYYQKALKWDDNMHQQAANKALGWQVKPHNMGVVGANQVLHLMVTDAQGKPVTGLKGTVLLQRTDQIAQIPTTLKEDQQPGNYVLSAPALKSGLWDLLVTFESGQQKFADRFRIEI